MKENYKGDPSYTDMIPQTSDLVVKFKLGPNAIAPTRGTDGAAGWDLYVSEDTLVGYHQPTIIQLGISIEIPHGWEAQMRPRSSSAIKRHLHCVFGTIDSDYRGEIKGVAWSTCTFTEPYINYPVEVKKGERLYQLVFARVPTVEWVQVDELTESKRGANGHGSTGK